MKSCFVVAAVLLLSACASGPPQFHAQFSGASEWMGPTSIDDPRLMNPRFYMDDDNLPAWTRAAPAPRW